MLLNDAHNKVAEFSEPLSARDAWFLYAERPDTPLDIGTVYVFDSELPFGGGPGAVGIEETIAYRPHLVPHSRQRSNSVHFTVADVPLCFRRLPGMVPVVTGLIQSGHTVMLFFPILHRRSDSSRLVRLVLRPLGFAWLAFVLVYSAFVAVAYVATGFSPSLDRPEGRPLRGSRNSCRATAETARARAACLAAWACAPGSSPLPASCNSR